MSANTPLGPEVRLVQDLLRGLSTAVRDAPRSLGLVGAVRLPAQPPEHCLRACLGGDPQAVAARGCPFLRLAARGQIEPSELCDGRCAQGFAVAAQRAIVGEESAVIVTVAGPWPPTPQLPGPDSPRDAQVAPGDSLWRADRLGSTKLRQTEPGPADGQTLLGELDAATRLVQRVGQLLAENSGFANEVLQTYEQLNLIFDLTQQISQVTDLAAIEGLLLKRVARLLAAETVCVVGGDGRCRAHGRGGREAELRGPQADRREAELRGPLPGGLGATQLPLTEPGSSGSRRAGPGAPGAAPGSEACATTIAGTNAAALGAAVDLVRRTRHVQVAWAGLRQMIAGPLVRLDDQVDVVLAARAPAGPGFASGDMMLFESVLAFGGQIISNTELHERLRRMSLEVTRALVAAIDKKDHYTSGHSERGGFLTRLTAQELGVPATQVETMEWAGLLHDIGKIGIPEEILCKPGKLTPEEFDVIKQHPRMGAEILQPIASLRVVLDGVLYHHEYPDGTGYPEGLKGEAIPLVARIIHVVDTFDALTSTRSYRQAFSVTKAFQIIREEKGRRIDAEAAEAFIRAFEQYRATNPADYAVRFAHLREREACDVQS